MANSRFKDLMEQLHQKREETGLDKNGKKYSMVKDRVEVFRREFGDEFGIDTHVEYREGFANGAVIVATAKIVDKNGTVMSSGHATETVGGSEITSTSALESAETAAVGRALAFFGLHGGEFPSDMEMRNVPDSQQVMSAAQPQVAREQYSAIRDVPRRYVPPKNDDLDHAAEASKIADSLVHIESFEELSTYWHDLREYREFLSTVDTVLLAEITSAFSVRKSMFNGRN